METQQRVCGFRGVVLDRKSTRLNSSHSQISYAVFCLKKKKKHDRQDRKILDGIVRLKCNMFEPSRILIQLEDEVRVADLQHVKELAIVPHLEARDIAR